MYHLEETILMALCVLLPWFHMESVQLHVLRTHVQTCIKRQITLLESTPMQQPVQAKHQCHHRLAPWALAGLPPLPTPTPNVATMSLSSCKLCTQPVSHSLCMPAGVSLQKLESVIFACGIFEYNYIYIEYVRFEVSEEITLK